MYCISKIINRIDAINECITSFRNQNKNSLQYLYVFVLSVYCTCAGYFQRKMMTCKFIIAIQRNYSQKSLIYGLLLFPIRFGIIRGHVESVKSKYLLRNEII